MEMEVMIPIHNLDFDFNSARSSPRHISAPSTPKGFGEYYFSAPTSPSRISQFYRDFEDFLITNGDHENGSYQTEGGPVAAVPFDWEEKPGKPKSPRGANSNEDHDFAFDVSEDFETSSVSAEELFDGGVIKPLKPPPRLKTPPSESSPLIISPRSHSRKTIMGAFSPRHKKDSASPFSTSAQKKSNGRTPERERGRERAPGGMSSSSRRAARSLSPLRVSEYPWEEYQEDHQQQQPNKERSSTSTNKPSHVCSTLTSSSSSKNIKKWSFKDFFLFRSASEGRAADKDPFRKYTAFRRYEEVKISNNSSRKIESTGSMSRRRGPVSAHELHYTINRAVSEDMKKKTFLPYKQGILGRLAFNPTVHALANGFGFSRN